MSVNPDMSANMGVADEYVDLEHQVIRQAVDLVPSGGVEVTSGDPGADFEPGERQLDREEVAQLVYYRRYATLAYQGNLSGASGSSSGAATVDASVGINGDLFRPVTTQQEISPEFDVDTGGEIGLLDHYELSNWFPKKDNSTGIGVPAQQVKSEFHISYYDWPTGGPIVDSFDTITCGFKADNSDQDLQGRLELRYDFYWDVAEQGRTTNPFGRPSTR